MDAKPNSSRLDAQVATAGSTEAANAGDVLPRHMPGRVVLGYLAFGAVWIFITARLPQWFGLDAQRTLQFQAGKEWLFIAGSAVLLYVLLTALQRRSEVVLAALLESRNEIRRINADLEQRVTERTRQLEAANRELEAFAYAVSHDLRAPLRSLSGFSQILREAAPAGLDEKSRHYLQRIHEASVRMSGLIEELLNLSRVSRSELVPRALSLSQLCVEAAAVVRDRYSGREVALTVEPELNVHGDPRLLRIALENLLDNAWKYSAQQPHARVSVGTDRSADEIVYFVRDNGIGFDMAYAGKLFGPFQRLHAESQFSGTGIGLVTVQRIIAMHGGRIWADAAPDCGATFYFTLGKHSGI